MAEDFIDLERYKRDCDNDREIFRPTFSEGEAYPFKQSDRSVDKCADAQFLEAVIIDIRQTFEQMMDKVIPGINTDYVYPVVNDRFNIMMEKFQNAESGGEEQEPLKDFVNGDVKNAFGPRPGGCHPFNCTTVKRDDGSSEVLILLGWIVHRVG